MDATSALSLPPGALAGEEPRARPIVRPKKPAKPARSVEPLSPFVPWSESERTTLPELSELATERQLLGELLREPASIVERLLEPSRLQGLILGSVGITSTRPICSLGSAARIHDHTTLAPYPAGRHKLIGRLFRNTKSICQFF